MGEDGNSIKVNLIKQDDGGSPIRHYLVKYRAVSGFFQSSRSPDAHLVGGTACKVRGGGAGGTGAASAWGKWPMVPGQGFKFQDGPTAFRSRPRRDCIITSKMSLVMINPYRDWFSFFLNLSTM